MKFTFTKYHGTGNDFIIIDNRKKVFAPRADREQTMIALLCHRQYGVGADGLILIEEDAAEDYRMHYYNSDGKMGSLCGNGSRCAAAFASHFISPGKQQFRFRAVDGIHEATIINPHPLLPIVSVTLNPVKYPLKASPANYIVDTGSPHWVRFVSGLSGVDVVRLGRKIRHAKEWAPEGINVNFVEESGKNVLSVRTYERGVEEETLSCGTGVTAAAIAAWAHHDGGAARSTNEIHTPGGKLEVSFHSPENHHNNFYDINLKGPAQFVFKGEMYMETLQQALSKSNESTEQ